MKKTGLQLALAICICAIAYIGGTIAGNYAVSHEEKTVKNVKKNAIVRLVQKDMTFCTGTVISRSTILTAAHCVVMDSPFGALGYRQDIEIRATDNYPTGITASVKKIRYQLDQAVLMGDFSKFNTRIVISDVKQLTILRNKGTFTACGYPLGGPFFCGPMFYRKPNGFMWEVDGVLIPGMSGGPVFDENGNIIATNDAVMGEYSIISPTYNVDEDQR